MKRVFLKLSGEALAGEKHTGFDEPTVTEVARQVKQITDQGIQVGIVIGGGNFWRGRTSETIDRTKADQIGMLATVMNCIYVSEIFRSVGMKTQIPSLVKRVAIRYFSCLSLPILEKVIFPISCESEHSTKNEFAKNSNTPLSITSLYNPFSSAISVDLSGT